MIRLSAGVALVDAGRVLLVPHVYKDGRPKRWYVPGGAVEVGERLFEAAQREVLEETGLEVAVGALLDVRETIHVGWHGVRLTFAGQITGGSLRAEPRRQALTASDLTPCWFSLAELDHLRVVPRLAVRKALGLEPLTPLQPWLDES